MRWNGWKGAKRGNSKNYCKEGTSDIGEVGELRWIQTFFLSFHGLALLRTPDRRVSLCGLCRRLVLPELSALEQLPHRGDGSPLRLIIESHRQGDRNNSVAFGSNASQRLSGLPCRW